MNEQWRVSLYLLGLIPQALFGIRFLMQWLVSEWLHRSTVPRLFWQLSLLGNVMMLAHASCQLQYHIAVIQATNGVIAWRNLDLMGRRRASTAITLALLLLVSLAVTVLFLWIEPQGFSSWFRTPQLPWLGGPDSLIWQWHLFGTIALILFSSRFWLQWWQAECEQESHLGLLFWSITSIGNIMLFIYFWQLRDIVNGLGPLLMTIPAIRNISLLRRRPDPYIQVLKDR